MSGSDNETAGAPSVRSGRSDDFFRKIYEQSNTGIAITDLRGVFQECNRAYCALVGYTEEELRTIDFASLIHPEDREANLVQSRRVQLGELSSFAIENRYIRKNGEPVWVHKLVSVLPGEKGAPAQMIALVTDTTRRHIAEEMLRASEERYRELAEHATDGIFATDSQGRYVDANRAGCEVFGYTLEELKTITVRDVIPPEELHRLPEQFERLGRGETVRNDWRFRRKDGSMFIGELICRQFDDGRLQGVVRDITERKQIEAALRDEAKRKDEFLALLGHELRNPLAAISTAIQVLSDGVDAGRRAEIEGMMSRQVNLMRRLLDDLLDLGRITHGHIELKKEPIDLAEFIQKSAASLQSVIASRRQELVLRLPSESVVFMVDRMRLDQIASNLLSNASKYSGPGCRIEFSGAREGSAIVLHCKDNGQGVLLEYRDKIFEPFTRGRDIHDSHGEASLGIGLALAKQLTELHGGTISVDSAGADMGSDFIVRLPLIPPQFAAGSADAKPEVRSHGGGSIIIVEDNSDIAELMQIALNQAGYQVHTFADGVSALAAVSDRKPDAVLLDIGLPGMDGYELAAEMKKRRPMGDALFIGLSGFKRREEEVTSGGDFDHYFTKPVDIRALLALLDARSRQQSREASRVRVLLVEDHPDLAAATEGLLRSEGLEVQTALTGRDALEMAQNFRPQLILCDMNLPDMDGLEVIRRVKSASVVDAVQAVILTAMSELEIQAYNRKAGKLGVDAFIGKPIKADIVRNLAAALKPQ